MKKYLIVFMFFLSAFSYANNLAIKSIEDKESPMCWAVADAAESSCCGLVGCDFALWERVYLACNRQS
jgi:hypothetical protein